ncbi:MAG: exodeoxyribonuclease VII large subunit [Anaerolineaceae bacterium]|nr:exodeoxyribonuclease VII large subunit [Anaerolineaceae bacterium]
MNYTVTELTEHIRQMFAENYHLQDVTIRGEISNMRRASSGHWYFTLKDDGAQLRCAMWRSYAGMQNYVPEDGAKVEAHGYIDLYAVRGEYQLIADRMRPVGVGDLYAQFEQLKATLDAEGLFDPVLKRPVPYFPTRIGVVTSPDAAAFQDIQNVLRRRFPLADILLSPTAVQGESAPPQIVAALDRLNQRDDVDVILLIRGGGSIEDLWAFNDERVARAVAASRIPVISGVGHETDSTIVDFVSDLRAPTPSAAAEQATPHIDDLYANVRQMREALAMLMRLRVADRRDDLEAMQRALRHLSPNRQIAMLRQRIDDMNARLERGQQGRMSTLRERLEGRTAALHAASPQAILARGYAIVTHSDTGQRVQDSQDASPGDAITVQLHDGEIKARVEDTETHEQYRRTLF